MVTMDAATYSVGRRIWLDTEDDMTSPGRSASLNVMWCNQDTTADISWASIYADGYNSGTTCNDPHWVYRLDGVDQSYVSTSWYNNSCTTLFSPAWDVRLVSKSPQQRLRDILRSRIGPTIITGRKPLQLTKAEAEIRARETLKRVLGAKKYYKFIKNGFVSVRAKSGLVYQIYTGPKMTNVYKDGILSEKLCVVLMGKFPPTDSLIMRYLLILNDESEFRKLAIPHTPVEPQTFKIINAEGNLIDAWGDIKAA